MGRLRASLPNQPVIAEADEGGVDLSVIDPAEVRKHSRPVGPDRQLQTAPAMQIVLAFEEPAKERLVDFSPSRHRGSIVA